MKIPKTTLNDFINDFIFKINLDEIDEEKANKWHSRSFYSQMMDVWGEVDKTINAYKENRSEEDILTHLNLVSKLCSIVYLDPKVLNGAKYELRVAEWELYDFLFWDNEFHNTVDTIMNWFNQWCFDINYELLS